MEVEIQKVTPFSNGTEFMMWLDGNCDRCVRSFKPKNGELPDYGTTQKLVNLGRECKMKFAIDLACVDDGTVTAEIASLVGWNEKSGWPQQCLMFSDDEDDGWKPAPRKPKDEPDCQLCLPLAINEIELTITKNKLELCK